MASDKQSRITKRFISDHIDGNSLDLSVCLLLNVPVYELRQFSHLRILDLSQNKLTEISESFATLTFLVELDLSKNSLSYLPCNFGELQQLQKLDLFGNCLTSLPLSFSQLHCLRWLDLRENQLDSEMATAAGDCTNEKECKLCAVKVVSLMKCKIAEEEDKQKKLQEKQQVRQKKKDKAEKYQMEQAKRIKHEEKIRRRILWEKNQLLHQVKSTIESEEENNERPGKFKQYCCSKRLQLFCFLFILIAIATGVLVLIYKGNITVHLKSSPL